MNNFILVWSIKSSIIGFLVMIIFTVWYEGSSFEKSNLEWMNDKCHVKIACQHVPLP